MSSRMADEEKFTAGPAASFDVGILSLGYGGECDCEGRFFRALRRYLEVKQTFDVPISPSASQDGV